MDYVQKAARQLIRAMLRDNLVGPIGCTTPNKEVAAEVAKILISENVTFLVHYHTHMVQFTVPNAYDNEMSKPKNEEC